MAGKRLIDANAFKIFLEEVRHDYLEEGTFSSDFAAKVIETVQDEYLANAPTVDAVEVVHGRWVKDEQSRFEHRYNCSACNYRLIDEPCNYCPNCGAKMDGGADDA